MLFIQPYKRMNIKEQQQKDLISSIQRKTREMFVKRLERLTPSIENLNNLTDRAKVQVQLPTPANILLELKKIANNQTLKEEDRDNEINKQIKKFVDMQNLYKSNNRPLNITIEELFNGDTDVKKLISKDEIKRRYDIVNDPYYNLNEIDDTYSKGISYVKQVNMIMEKIPFGTFTTRQYSYLDEIVKDFETHLKNYRKNPSKVNKDDLDRGKPKIQKLIGFLNEYLTLYNPEAVVPDVIIKTPDSKPIESRREIPRRAEEEEQGQEEEEGTETMPTQDFKNSLNKLLTDFGKELDQAKAYGKIRLYAYNNLNQLKHKYNAGVISENPVLGKTINQIVKNFLVYRDNFLKKLDAYVAVGFEGLVSEHDNILRVFKAQEHAIQTKLRPLIEGDLDENTEYIRDATLKDIYVNKTKKFNDYITQFKLEMGKLIETIVDERDAIIAIRNTPQRRGQAIAIRDARTPLRIYDKSPTRIEELALKTPFQEPRDAEKHVITFSKPLVVDFETEGIEATIQDIFNSRDFQELASLDACIIENLIHMTGIVRKWDAEVKFATVEYPNKIKNDLESRDAPRNIEKIKKDVNDWVNHINNTRDLFYRIEDCYTIVNFCNTIPIEVEGDMMKNTNELQNDFILRFGNEFVEFAVIHEWHTITECCDVILAILNEMEVRAVHPDTVNWINRNRHSFLKIIENINRWLGRATASGKKKMQKKTLKKTQTKKKPSYHVVLNEKRNKVKHYDVYR